jgi:phthalate 3,4-dioxygenase ferredoxin reductase subunit
MTQRVVIVGSGIGGIRTAQALRSAGYAGQVVVVGEEPDLPYDRPPLSKDYLAGQGDAESVALISHADAAEAGISLRLGASAERIVPEEKSLVLGNGEVLPYDVCVVATGACARPTPWNKLDGVHVLRSLADSQALREQLRRGREVAVIGGGFIGSEVAATARKLGLEVTVIDPLPLPLERTLGATVAQLVTDLHHRNGVTTLFGAGVDSIDNSGTQLNLQLSTGATLTTDAVVLGIGAIPNDGWLAGSGLPVENGLVCDAYCRVEGRDDIFAVGDVARWYNQRHDAFVRVEHWTNAVEQARCVAHNITFPDQLMPYEAVEYVWTDHYDWKIQIAGRPTHDAVETGTVVGDFAGPRPRGAVLYGDSAGLLCGAVTVNWARAIAVARQALAAHTPYQEALDTVTALRR